MNSIKKAFLIVLVGLFITNLTAFKVSYRRYSSCALMPGAFCTEGKTVWEIRGVPEYLSRTRDPSMDPNSKIDTDYKVDVEKYLRAVAIWSLVITVLMGLSELEKRLKNKAKVKG